MPQLSLNVIIATFNRSTLLRRSLESLVTAERPVDLDVTVTIVDSSSDDTRQIVEEFQARNEVPILYLFESRKGKSRALNTGIENSTADLVGLTDDDIEVSEDWFVQISKLFRENWETLDFAGGKVLPRWEIKQPSWLPESMPGVLSCHDHGDENFEYGSEFGGQLTGAHGVIKLSALREVGPYNENLGPVAGSLMGSEDDEMYLRLLAAGKRGIYCHKLVVFHRIPAYRLTKKYYRQWCYGWGASQSVIDSASKSVTGPRILGIPRHLHGSAVRSIYGLLKNRVLNDPGPAFENELTIWTWYGFVSERYVEKGMFGPVVKRFRRELKR